MCNLHNRLVIHMYSFLLQAMEKLSVMLLLVSKLQKVQNSWSWIPQYMKVYKKRKLKLEMLFILRLTVELSRWIQGCHVKWFISVLIYTYKTGILWVWLSVCLSTFFSATKIPSFMTFWLKASFGCGWNMTKPDFRNFDFYGFYGYFSCFLKCVF